MDESRPEIDQDFDEPSESLEEPVMTYQDMVKATEIDSRPPTPPKKSSAFSSTLSLAPVKTHVFLTWHDVRFEVPN